MTKNEAWAHFYTLSLSLTLNGTSTSLGNNNYLGTLNPKLARTGWKFSKKTCPVLQNKNKENRFSFMWEPEVGSPCSFHNQPCQPVLTLRTGLRTGSRFENSPTLVNTSVGQVYGVRDWYQYWYEHWYQIPDQSSMT
jgi:hypothetical protein